MGILLSTSSDLYRITQTHERTPPRGQRATPAARAEGAKIPQAEEPERQTPGGSKDTGGVVKRTQGPCSPQTDQPPRGARTPTGGSGNIARWPLVILCPLKQPPVGSRMNTEDLSGAGAVAPLGKLGSEPRRVHASGGRPRHPAQGRRPSDLRCVLEVRPRSSGRIAFCRQTLQNCRGGNVMHPASSDRVTLEPGKSRQRTPRSGPEARRWARPALIT